jgi:CheY-like chemotaxis protein
MKTINRILLVEDDKDDQESFVLALSGIKDSQIYDVVNNGVEALERLSNSDVLPSHIFMDVNMPRMNGIDCLSEIVNNPLTKDIHVVMLTTSVGQAERAQQMGARAFIKKPTSDKTLRSLLEQVLNMDFKTKILSEQPSFQLAF